jgi:hypothetical protein
MMLGPPVRRLDSAAPVNSSWPIPAPERSSADCVGGGIAELIGSAIPAASSILVTSSGSIHPGQADREAISRLPPITGVGPGSRLIMSSAVW